MSDDEHTVTSNEEQVQQRQEQLEASAEPWHATQSWPTNEISINQLNQIIHECYGSGSSGGDALLLCSISSGDDGLDAYEIYDKQADATGKTTKARYQCQTRSFAQDLGKDWEPQPPFHHRPHYKSIKSERSHGGDIRAKDVPGFFGSIANEEDEIRGMHTNERRNRIEQSEQVGGILRHCQ